MTTRSRFASFSLVWLPVRGLAALVLVVTASALTLADEDEKSPEQLVIDGLELRAIGPAVTGGRIADIAVHPTKRSTWYVAAGSGGVWKTENAGTTWTPIFENLPSYSIGEITLDPTNADVVWVGTGENVSGRHVGWGDGVYRSRDGGSSWEQMGLERSEHIGRILVNPDDPMQILVAAEGPLWSSGGERGVYRSVDGGGTWSQVLAVDEDTGATDLEFHPEDPSTVYAATYQRRRTVWSFLAGGPGSGIWKSTDAGATWREVTQGLPTADASLEVGKIGLAVTPADPDRVYATVEANDDKQGFYVSMDRGESWERRNAYISGGTGPHYYQEIEASPRDADRVYQMDVFLHVTADAGRNFDYLESGFDKHSDNHALWIDPDAPRHLLAGTDAGLYESYDDGVTWRHFPNMPISQFYKIAVSSREPYYDVLAGAQDLGTLHGPARTLNVEGVRNQDWNVPYGADGYGVAFDPADPDLFYQMSQRGNLLRHHAVSGENVSIRPQPAPGDPPERWNWDSPIAVSAHVPGRIYFASQRVWRSDDRGNSWTPVSGDLTRGENRFELPVASRIRSTDALWDLGAMSAYASLTALSESAVDGAVLWTGSDDGLVYVSRNGGESWKAVTPRGLPERAFINDIEASRHNANAAFVVADNHKTGDYRPLVFETGDGGRSWKDISGDLPDGVIAWSIQQDHVEAGLLFLGAENGVYVSVDGGGHWQKLSKGVPTIPFRDLALQRRDNDLVAASFGRGIYVLDDYSPLRQLAALRRGNAQLAPAETPFALFDVRDAWWYLPSVPGQAKGLPTRGSTDWRAANPAHGVSFTVYIGQSFTDASDRRARDERRLADAGKDIPFPGWDVLAEEGRAQTAGYMLEISDKEGNTVRRLEVPNERGVHRLAWDMRGAVPDRIALEQGGFRSPWSSIPVGPLLAPGRYAAQLQRVDKEGVAVLGEPTSFALRSVDNLPGEVDYEEAAQFRVQVADAKRRLSAVDGIISETEERLQAMRAAASAAPSGAADLPQKIDVIENELLALKQVLRGNPARRRLSEFTVAGVATRIQAAGNAGNTRLGATTTQRESLRLGLSGLADVEVALNELLDGPVANLEEALRNAAAPWIPGQRAGR